MQKQKKREEIEKGVFADMFFSYVRVCEVP